MADASRHPSPSGWGDAFAALPLDTPPTSRWAAIEVALDDARAGHAGHDATTAPARGRSRGVAWGAWAAAIAAIALPAALWLRPGAEVAPSTMPPVAVATQAGSAHDHMAMPHDRMTTPVASGIASTPPTEPAASPAKTTARAPAARIAGIVAPTTASPTAGARAKPWPRARMALDHDDGARMQAAFEPYYAEAARLERVIAGTRDPRVASAPAAALAGALDAELAALDARLAQPGLDAGQRLALWDTRVSLLRASADFESQLRLLAAEGDALDGTLVAID